MLRKLQPYLLNGFLLTIPILIWNVFFVAGLPDFFLNQPVEGMPKILLSFEHLFRILFFIMAYLMPLTKASFKKTLAWMLYIFGVLLYFASWSPLLSNPSSVWSQSLWGVMAPSITPMVWMSGIVLLGDRFSFGIPYRKWIYWLVMLSFILCHNLSIVWAFWGTNFK